MTVTVTIKNKTTIYSWATEQRTRATEREIMEPYLFSKKETQNNKYKYTNECKRKDNKTKENTHTHTLNE